MTEDSGRTAAAGRTQFPVVDGGIENRTAGGDTKRPRKGFILKKAVHFEAIVVEYSCKLRRNGGVRSGKADFFCSGGYRRFFSAAGKERRAETGS